ncbi:hypothetical protein A6R68_15151 [Neotoma lepida]|uniref:UPAR/Ly6 domain-containing protein n=1 Tax=Neotoma lepida TaxID=56216 RepID=A0A1A6H6T8_NEOLE|nr:hypothetical protein A6R68_15151 [Neotoma lepida]
MKGILIAGVFAAFAVTVIDSLNCTQCHSLNSTCEAGVQECEEESFSCVESSVNSTLGGSFYSYENKFCSPNNCSENNTQVAFTVHVSNDQRFHFASQCCQGKACNDTNHVELKGCSDISDATCEFLSTENTTVGEVVFRMVQCKKEDTVTVTPTPSASTGIKASFISSVFGSLLLLKLLF